MTKQTNNAKPEAPKTQDEFERDIARLHTNAEKGGITPTTGESVQVALNAMAGQDSTTVMGSSAVAGYEDLKLILELAYEQAASGKGSARHATGPMGRRPWTNQPIMENARQVGPGGPAFQAMKKVQEAVTLVGNGKFEAAQAEALGAIVYAAALYRLVFEMNLHNNGG